MVIVVGTVVYVSVVPEVRVPSVTVTDTSSVVVTGTYCVVIGVV